MLLGGHFLFNIWCAICGTIGGNLLLSSADLQQMCKFTKSWLAEAAVAIQKIWKAGTSVLEENMGKVKGVKTISTLFFVNFSAS